MNLKLTLLKRQEKKRVVEMAEYIGSDKKKFSELMDLFLNGDNRTSQNASWVVSHVFDREPQMMIPYYDDFIGMLQKPVHNAVKRNITRILGHQEIPEEHLGILAELCFNFVNDTKEAIAVRVFSLTVLYQICLKEPELASELKLTIETFMPQASAGFKSRGKKILNALDKKYKIQ